LKETTIKPLTPKRKPQTIKMLQQNRILILGIGNYLMGDEGLGVHAAVSLQQETLPDCVDVVDGGTGGFHLLEYFETYDNIILIDATLDDNPNGTIRLIQPRFAQDFPKAMSTHDIGLKDMVSALQLMGKMPAIHLFVMSIESLQQQGIELTEEIEAAMPQLMASIKSLVNDMLLKKMQLAPLRLAV
jgi:hydrogenase maturation protease